mmetsp:Transcript_61751/g.170785  ORF Transcript_61751/g.170785 Transcript_61751/m.170785 type:complete len:191 (-) Transcript_61751:140-712(-)
MAQARACHGRALAPNSPPRAPGAMALRGDRLAASCSRLVGRPGAEASAGRIAVFAPTPAAAASRPLGTPRPPTIARSLSEPFGARAYHKFAKPPSPNLDNIRRVISEKLTPIYFYARNNLIFTNWVWDMHFVGVICSPKFEGKTHKEMNAMVEECCEAVGMKGRVKLICHPPSRWHMMRRRARKRWYLDM